MTDIRPLCLGLPELSGVTRRALISRAQGDNPQGGASSGPRCPRGPLTANPLSPLMQAGIGVPPPAPMPGMGSAPRDYHTLKQDRGLTSPSRSPGPEAMRPYENELPFPPRLRPGFPTAGPAERGLPTMHHNAALRVTGLGIMGGGSADLWIWPRAQFPLALTELVRAL
ncbi:hypothetical protein AAFF_G00042400 [Aldrovandia affinis]|uniref:Uncharacterized protein n=1 Tax=Aldrovandia affinis TaxID=143900 RepID=A0AAD7S2M7_9TELE|nr:hypothetical protein AAFF_G00042400 [Aldrovandia affinis]